MSDMKNDNNKIRRKKVSNSKQSPENNSNSYQRRSNSNKNKKYLKVISIVFLALMVLGSSIATAVTFAALKNTEPITKKVIQDKLETTSYILDSNGEVRKEIRQGEKKETVKLNQIPKDLQNAIVAIEDERFFEHKGVDWKGLIRSTLITMFTDTTQGGSTLNMQLSKNLLTSTEQSVIRKIKDIYYALEIDKAMSKEDILSAYLNDMSIGRGTKGVQAGSKTFFGKDVSELTLAESAMLAGSTKNPSRYSPYIMDKLNGTETKEDLIDKIGVYTKTDGFDAATDVEKSMFSKLRDWGLIDSKQYSELENGTMVVRKAVPSPHAKKRQEIVLYKMKELGYITEQEYTEAKASPIEIKVSKDNANNDTSYIYDLVIKDVEKKLIEEGYEEEEALNLIYGNGIKIYSTMDYDMQKELEKDFENNSNFPGTYTNKEGVVQPQGAMVIMDYSTGQIRALIGGRQTTGSKLFNRATNLRQPGSSIKPLSVYTAAIDNGMTQADLANSSMGGYKFKDNNRWNPKNSHSMNGQMTLRKALEDSSNTVAVKTGETLGSTYGEAVDVMKDYLKNFGITSLKENGKETDNNFSALTLGGMSEGISPLEMTAAYGALANGGTYVEPITFTKVETSDGQILIQNEPEKHKVVDPEVAYVITDMMTAVVESGTGGRAKLSHGIPVAGKTGTTNGNKDAWFVGYTPHYVAATWIGDDKNQPLKHGSSMAAGLWKQVMNDVHKNLEASDFKRPSNIEFAKINLNDGGLSSSGYNAADAAFIKGTVPSRASTAKKPEEKTNPNYPLDPITGWPYDPATGLPLPADPTTGKPIYPSTQPGTTPGTQPGTTPGTQPGTTPGTQPGTTPGTQPGTTPGTQPGTTPGADTGGKKPGKGNN
jgi:penicillin-binding protein 1A